MNLPPTEELPVDKLAAVFNDTTNSYKYYWFLAQFEFLKTCEQSTIPIDVAIFEMIASAWYPVNYWRLSFGKQDKLSSSIQEIQKLFGLPVDIKRKELLGFLLKNKNDKVIKQILITLSRYVPYRFLTPWYSEEIRGAPDSKKNNLIIQLSMRDYNERPGYALYRILNGEIEVSPGWRSYLVNNISIILGYTYWHLLQYLQKNNPNVPNISEKLSHPEYRSMGNARLFWNTYLELKKTTNCIYSNDEIFVANYCIDHFVPWTFVAHDQLWNLVPIPKNVNSLKGDKLPSPIYMKKFVEIQYDAFHTTYNFLKGRALEDYSILFNDSISEISRLHRDDFEEIIAHNIKPLLQIATNMGYSTNWIWKHPPHT